MGVQIDHAARRDSTTACNPRWRSGQLSVMGQEVGVRRGGSIGEDDFAALFAEHHDAVLAYGARRVDLETARDVAAETFLVAWRRLEVAPEHPRSWLLACARRVLANELRRRGRHQRLVDRVALDVPPDGADADTDPGWEDRAAVRSALAGLSARDREVLTLFGWEQLDQREIAEVLGCSVGAVKVRLHRARRRLAGAIAEGAPGPPGLAPDEEPATGRTMATEGDR